MTWYNFIGKADKLLVNLYKKIANYRIFGTGKKDCFPAENAV